MGGPFGDAGRLFSDAQGNIPVTQVIVNRLSGSYRLCFYETVGFDRESDPMATATRPVSLGIL